MKRKKIIKFIVDLFNKPLVMVILYLAGILLILGLSGAFSSNQTFLDVFLEIITSQDTLTLFFAGLFSLGLAKAISLFDKYMEESLKTEDNHHKIISQYKKHKLGKQSYKGSFADQNGVYFLLKHTRKNDRLKKPSDSASKQEFEEYREALNKRKNAIVKRNSIKDKQSKPYQELAKRAERYLSGELCLCSLNMFANVSGDTEIRFEDSAEKHELPSFVISHADEILQAHKNSAKNNSTTVRLNYFDYDANTVTLNTARSTYYHMLITNRCMDYKFANGMSIRELYEYDSEICPLKHSKLGNQIGINGLVVTNDNYILVEKRGQKKITWKNKFAQSISLALKLNALGIDRRGSLDNSCETAEQKLKGIIENTIKDNFGLTANDFETFTIKENFLGLARDLLEGGKPNLYFYVKVNYSAEQLKQKLEDNVTVIYADNEGKAEEEKRPVIATSKLESDYYLIPFEHIDIDFNYRMFVDKKCALKVRRKLHPRTTRVVEWWDRFKEKSGLLFNPVLVRECGEALLVTIAYLELRWDWYQNNKNKENEEAKSDE